MMYFLLAVIMLEVVSSSAAAWLFRAGTLPEAVRDVLCLHKLLTPIIVALIAPFVALACSAFWPALAAAIVLSWLYLIFAVLSAGALMFEGSDGGVAYAVTVMWGAIASAAAAVSTVLIYLLSLMFR